MGPHLDQIFVAGGQPTFTYVERSSEHIEAKFARAVATPNQIVSLSGPTKTGKTVLCRRMLGKRQYVWIDGGLVASAQDFWSKISFELQLPESIESSQESSTTASVQAGIPMMFTGGGSQLMQFSTRKKRNIDSMASAMAHMLENNIMLVVDDFHYIKSQDRTDIMRNVKGSVFNGLKIVLLSVTHRVFDAIKAESELTGRFTATSLPHWTVGDLSQIPAKGFAELGTKCPQSIIDILCAEAQESPFLMQRFCWEICSDSGIERRKLIGEHHISSNYDLKHMFERLSQDAGLPIYQKLAAGPQSRKNRARRPLKENLRISTADADIYEAVLLACAESGPKPVLSYEELRSILNEMLADQMPQKHEITSALKHLAAISRKINAESAIDYDEDKREITLADPYLRFYLRWQIRREDSLAGA